mmetsp:Transcript_25900/g.65908  ORF Transcript_25900/g.65908 Transcript_25900/m.65908 type:complete len:220 (+) Transcript_25900:591-1250(+)
MQRPSRRPVRRRMRQGRSMHISISTTITTTTMSTPSALALWPSATWRMRPPMLQPHLSQPLQRVRTRQLLAQRRDHRSPSLRPCPPPSSSVGQARRQPCHQRAAPWQQTRWCGLLRQHLWCAPRPRAPISLRQAHRQAAARSRWLLRSMTALQPWLSAPEQPRQHPPQQPQGWPPRWPRRAASRPRRRAPPCPRAPPRALTCSPRRRLRALTRWLRLTV